MNMAESVNNVLLHNLRGQTGNSEIRKRWACPSAVVDMLQKKYASLCKCRQHIQSTTVRIELLGNKLKQLIHCNFSLCVIVTYNTDHKTQTIIYDQGKA
jgi:hypothetical protein